VGKKSRLRTQRTATNDSEHQRTTVSDSEHQRTTLSGPSNSTGPKGTVRCRTLSFAAGRCRSLPIVSWARNNGFILGLIAVVILAFLFPEPGSRNGWLHPELASNFGIALILFLQGLSMPLEKVRRGAGNWQLHVIIQAFTFVVFPIVGLGIQLVLPHIWTDEPEPIKQGFLYLCVLPSTVSTSVVLTSVAGGNTAAAILSAAFSNIVGVILTPLLVSFLMHATGRSGPIGPLLIQITLLTLLPFSLGMILRHFIRSWVDAHKRWINPISNGVILFIVYTAFCDSVQQKIWNKYGVILTVEVLLTVMVLFGGMSLVIYLVSRATRLNREDGIAVYFCSVKKTLAMGVPLAILIFGSRADLSLILLPIMFYHPFQLFVNGLLANRWARAGHSVSGKL
jgi:solute carrier family 10 (sodium/bile acid cotransporter), member 7